MRSKDDHNVDFPTLKEYCVYYTMYSGELLPPFYIGSTSTIKIVEGYQGSIRSKKYKKIWDQELKKNPNLFKTLIINTFNTREEAFEAEYNLQMLNSVMKNSDYVNESVAAKNGCFGRDVTGELNPTYGKRLAFCVDTNESLGYISPNDERWDTGEIRTHRHTDETIERLRKPKKSTKKLMEYHKNAIYKPCVFCGEDYKESSGALTTHKKYCLKNPNRISSSKECPFCGESFDYRSGTYTNHLKKCNKKETYEK